jgi:hypothetical protein
MDSAEGISKISPEKSNVTALPGYTIPLAQGEKNIYLIDALKDLLKQAEEGHLRAIAYATYKSTGSTSCNWFVGEYTHQLAASILMLHYEYAKALSDRDG